MKQKLVLIVILVFVVAAAVIAYPKLSAVFAPEEPPVVINGTAADFTVTDDAGNEVALSSFYGKPLVVNFWATWCPYCVQELPSFEKAAADYPDVTFLLVDMSDEGGETPADARAYLNYLGITVPSYYDTAYSAAYAYRITNIPLTLFIDRHGDLYTYHLGMMTEATLRAGIDDLVAVQ